MTWSSTALTEWLSLRQLSWPMMTPGSSRSQRLACLQFSCFLRSMTAVVTPAAAAVTRSVRVGAALLQARLVTPSLSRPLVAIQCPALGHLGHRPQLDLGRRNHLPGECVLRVVCCCDVRLTWAQGCIIRTCVQEQRVAVAHVMLSCFLVEMYVACHICALVHLRPPCNVSKGSCTILNAEDCSPPLMV